MSGDTGMAEQRAWPRLRVADWTGTRDTLHMWTQIVGKIRLAHAPLVNHWWQVTLYVTPARPDHVRDPVRDRRLRHRVRLRRPPAAHPHQRRRRARGGPGAEAGGRVLRRDHGRARRARHRDADPGPAQRGGAGDPVRRGPASTPPTTPRPPTCSGVSSSRPTGSWASSAPASSARSARCTSSGARMDLACTRFSGRPAPAPPRRRAELRRLGDGGGLLPRAEQLRLLARRGRRGRLLRLRLPRARRASPTTPSPRPAPTTAARTASSSCPTRPCAPPPTRTRALMGFLAVHLRGGRRARRLGPRRPWRTTPPAGTPSAGDPGGLRGRPVTALRFLSRPVLGAVRG